MHGLRRGQSGTTKTFRVGSLAVLVAAAALVTIGAQTPAVTGPTQGIGLAKVDGLDRGDDARREDLDAVRDPIPTSYGQAGYIAGVPRLGIPPLRLADGPAGIRTAQPATALPAPVAMASTFSPDLAKQYGQIIGRDARARYQNVVLAPMVNIVRVPQAGRNFETLGEDPLLASRLVAAEIEGIQGEGSIATVKHYAFNNQENARMSVSADVDEQTMREIELPGFEAAVRAGAGSVMAVVQQGQRDLGGREPADPHGHPAERVGASRASSCPTGARRTARCPRSRPAWRWRCRAGGTSARSATR